MVIKNVISKYHTKPDISLRVGKKYRVFFILGSICTVILSSFLPNHTRNVCKNKSCHKWDTV